jgi:hypothetical protein
MEEEVLRELDSIINHALDDEIPVDEEEDDNDEPFYKNTEAQRKTERPSTPEPDYDAVQSEGSSPSVPQLTLRAGSETSGYKTDSRESLDSPIPHSGGEQFEQPQYANVTNLNIVSICRV